MFGVQYYYGKMKTNSLAKMNFFCVVKCVEDVSQCIFYLGYSFDSTNENN